MEAKEESSGRLTEPSLKEIATPINISPTTVSMSMDADGDGDGEEMMEVIRSDGTQVFHTVNVNVNGIMKKIKIPIGNASHTLPESSSEPKKTKMSIENMVSNAVTVIRSPASAASTASSVIGSTLQTSVRIVQPTTGKFSNGVVSPSVSHSIKPAVGMRQTMDKLSTKGTVMLLPRPSASMQSVLVPNIRGNLLPTSIRLPGGGILLQKGQNVSQSKPIVTVIPQGQVNRVAAPTIPMPSQPHVNLPTGYRLVPVAFSAAQNISNTLVPPTMSRQNTAGSQNISDFLKSVAEQTVIGKTNGASLSTSLQVKTVPSGTSQTSVAPSATTVPPPLKVLPYSFSSTGFVTPTFTISPSPRATVQLSTAGIRPITNLLSKPMDMSEIKIDSVYSLNDNKTTENPFTVHDDGSEKNLRDLVSKGKDLKEDFVVLAEWAKESDNEGEENEFEDTDVDSAGEDPEPMLDRGNLKGEYKKGEEKADELPCGKNEKHSTSNSDDCTEKKDEPDQLSDNDSETTEIADELESDCLGKQLKLNEIKNRKDHVTEHDSSKENKAPDINQILQSNTISDDLTGKTDAPHGSYNDAMQNVKVNENGLIEVSSPLHSLSERCLEKKDRNTTVLKTESVLECQVNLDGAQKLIRKQRIRSRQRKRHHKHTMRVKYWKRDHKYMFVCKVLLARLNVQSSVNLKNFKIPVVPKRLLKNVRFVGDSNWNDVVVRKELNRQNKCKNKDFGLNEKREEAFIVETVDGVSKLMKVSQENKQKEKKLKTIAPKLRLPNTISLPLVTGSSMLDVSTLRNSISYAIKPNAGEIKTVTNSQLSIPKSASIVHDTNHKPTEAVVAKSMMQVEHNVDRAKQIKAEADKTAPYKNDLMAGAKSMTNAKKTPSTLIPIAPARTVPVTIGNNTVSVPVAMLLQAQALGCKLAFQVPTSTSQKPRPIFIHPTSSATGNVTHTPEPVQSSSIGKSLITVPAATNTVSGHSQMPNVVQSLLTNSTKTTLPKSLGPTALWNRNIKPLVIAPMPGKSISVSSQPVPVSSVKPIVVQPTSLKVSSSPAKTAGFASKEVKLPLQRNGSQKYLVLNTSSGKMIMPMLPNADGSCATKNIFNLPSVVPKQVPLLSTTTVTTKSPVMMPVISTSMNTPGSQTKAVILTTKGQPPVILKNLVSNSGHTPKAVFTFNKKQSESVIPAPSTASSTSLLSTSVPTTSIPSATSSQQRSPVARQNRMVQRLSEFMSPAAAAALAASVPVEPIEIAPKPIKIEPVDTAGFDFPVTIKDEPITVGYGDEDDDIGTNFENIKVKEEPASPICLADVNIEEPPSKRRRTDSTSKKPETSSVPISTNKAADFHKNDARSRIIDELRAKLKKAKADVDEIRQKRKGEIHSSGNANDS